MEEPKLTTSPRLPDDVMKNILKHSLVDTQLHLGVSANGEPMPERFDSANEEQPTVPP